MKPGIKLALSIAGSFVIGFAAGYLFRKKTFEVQIEEVSEEEFDELTKQIKETDNKTENDIQAFEQPAVPQDEKEAYFKRWKEEDPGSAYDTRTAESPEDVEVTDEDLNSISDYLKDLSYVEAGTMQDWVKYLTSPEGEYDTIELNWYEGDGVITDENDEPLEDSESYMGFDVSEQFQLVDPETTGDENVRIIFNHKTKSLYYINRIPHSAYSQMKRITELGNKGYDDKGDE